MGVPEAGPRKITVLIGKVLKGISGVVFVSGLGPKQFHDLPLVGHNLAGTLGVSKDLGALEQGLSLSDSILSPLHFASCF